MERWQSLHEHHVDVNLSDSGVHPMTISELIPDPARRAGLFEELLGYTQTNGSVVLRERIAALYAGATKDHLLVTTGGIEANFLATWRLLEPGDEAVVMTPNYMQIWGLAESFGARLRAWPLRPDRAGERWTASLDELEALLTPRTRFIAICNPNNPTGAVLDSELLDGVARLAARHGAYVIADEIYQGSELEGPPAPSMWGRYDRVLVTNSLSKAYGLPGLRLGWVLGSPGLIRELWHHHDYTTIAPAALSDRLARLALEPATRARLLDRTRRLLSANLDIVRRWLAQEQGAIRAILPRAGAMLTAQYSAEINSSELAERLRREKRVLLVPGDHFGMDGWLRLGFGGEPHEVEEGLKRLSELLETLR
jgi:hypothetical protein